MNQARSWWSNPRLWMVGIVLLAAAVRLPNLAWDQNHLFHHDERAIANAAGKVSIRELKLDPDWFNYGSLPIYLTRAAAELVSLVEPGAASYDGLIISGRRVSALFGILVRAIHIGTTVSVPATINTIGLGAIYLQVLDTRELAGRGMGRVGDSGDSHS
jgi:hypothetical protein